MGKVWFITGASRGLGRSLAEAVLAQGGIVAAAVRNLDQLHDLALTRAVLPYMRKQGSGRILQIGSILPRDNHERE